jgi:hypothetical protein
VKFPKLKSEFGQVDVSWAVSFPVGRRIAKTITIRKLLIPGNKLNREDNFKDGVNVFMRLDINYP